MNDVELDLGMKILEWGRKSDTFLQIRLKFLTSSVMYQLEAHVSC